MLLFLILLFHTDRQVACSSFISVFLQYLNKFAFALVSYVNVYFAIYSSEVSLRGLSPRANYNDRAAAVGRRS